MLSRSLSFCDFQRRVLGFQPTRAQRVYAAVAFDGVEPGGGSLRGRDRELARQMFGEVASVPTSARAVLDAVKGRAAGMSRMFAQRGLHLALSADLSSVDARETVYVLFGGPKLRHARIALRFARAEARKVAGLRIEGEGRDGFTVVRDDGRRVRLEVFSAGRGGDAGRGVPILFALLDEAAFYFDAASGAINDEDVFAALVPRLLPGGQIGIVSSPWTESGLLFDEFSKNHGAPRTCLAAHCPTELMRDDPTTLAMVERERERDPSNAQQEFDAQFMLGGGGQFIASEELRSARDSSIDLGTLPGPGVIVAVGVDPALVSDSAAAVVVHRERGGVLRVADLLELRPAKGRPLALDYVVAKFARLALAHGAKSLTSDAHMLSEVRRHAQPFGMRVSVVPGGSGGKQRTYQHARDMIRAGQVKFPDRGCERLLMQLSELVARPTSGGGLSISQPRRGGAHGDLASAFIAALWQARAADDAVERVLRARVRGERIGHRDARTETCPEHPPETIVGKGRRDQGVTFEAGIYGVIATPGRRDSRGRLGRLLDDRDRSGAGRGMY